MKNDGSRKSKRIPARLLALTLSVLCGIGATAQTVLRGDFNGDGKVDSDDAVYLLRHTLAPEKYEISQPANVNGDDTADTADAIHLLYHTMFPEKYALSDGASKGLAFSLNNDEKSYSVSGIGSCTDTKIVIPAEYNGLPVTAIGTAAFLDCHGLTEITIPDGVTSIGKSAFSGCYGLTSIVVENENEVYHSAGNCLIETASKTLVAGCKNSIIPSDGSVTSIGNNAFSSCRSLTEITIPSSVTSIGDGAFFACENLVRVVYQGTEAQWNAIKKAYNWASGPYTLVFAPPLPASKGLEFKLNYENGYSVVGIGSCTDTDIVIPAEYNGLPVTMIGVEAFYGCETLKSVTIPDGVTGIGNYAFQNCSNLTSVTIPDSVTGIYEAAFNSCSSLTSITIPDNITSIERWVFENCSSLTSITIPDNVTMIWDWAFLGCSSLTNVTIPNSVKGITDSAFGNCSSLETISFKGTQTQWDAISKVENWDEGAGSATSSGKYMLVFC